METDKSLVYKETFKRNKSGQPVSDHIPVWNYTFAPLQNIQETYLDRIEELLKSPTNKKYIDLPVKNKSEKNSEKLTVQKTNDFLNMYNMLCNDSKQIGDKKSRLYFATLCQFRDYYNLMSAQITDMLKELNTLCIETQKVSVKTDSLDKTSKELLRVQNQLIIVNGNMNSKLNVFMTLETISQRLASPMMSVGSEQFFELLKKIDDGIEFSNQHRHYKESTKYMAQFKYCLTRAISLIKIYINNTLNHATQSAVIPVSQQTNSQLNSGGTEQALSFYYGKFQASAHKIQPVIQQVEIRADSFPEYGQLLSEIQQLYLDKRYYLLNNSLASSMQELAGRLKNDRSSLFRSSCSLFLHVSQDEHHLYYVFFTKSTDKFRIYLEQLCSHLYDTLRPFIIHIEHIEVLCELCMILRREMLENVDNNREALVAFGNTVNQLLQDLQERLVFRAHIYFRTNILEYKPSPGDLAYPDKLHMMMKVLSSVNEKNSHRSESRSSIESGSVCSDVAKSFQSHQSCASSSHADLHGMWYPTVRRTLQCLSQLYRCVDLAIFQGLSQEAISFCVRSVIVAAEAITVKTSPIDGELFQIKHLLILREQIAPFQVDFTIKETSLDFTNVKMAAAGLMHRKQLFSFDSHNAILKFLLDGTPHVKEYLLDSRKDVDWQLKKSCENFILFVSHLLTGPLIKHNQKIQEFLKSHQENASVKLRNEQWAHPEEVATIVRDVKRNIKTRLHGISHAMTLYVHNKETEAILFRPIKSNIIGAFIQLEQNLSECGYNENEILLIACPTGEQVCVMLSSTALLVNHERSSTPTPKV